MTKEAENILLSLQEPLYWHIRRLVVDHEDARDILQDTLVTAFTKFSQLKDISALRAWVYRIATNEALTLVRKKSRYSSDEGQIEYLQQTLMASEWVDYQNQGVIRMQKAFLELSPQQKTVFSMRYYDEMSYEEISRITGSSVGTLKVAYHNAKEKIQKYIVE